jgi:hypothetical protein
MSSVAACFASVLSVKRTLSCKTEDKTLRVDQPLYGTAAHIGPWPPLYEVP